MNDTLQQKVENIVREKSSTSEDAELVVQSSKDRLQGPRDVESFCFWIWVYGSMESTIINGREYHVIAYNQDGIQVRSVPENGDSPVAPESRWIKWENTDLQKSNYI